MRVKCEIEEIEIEGDYAMMDGVMATCSRCEHTTESAGTGPNSITRCLALLREECPRRERNFYVKPEPD